LIALVWRAASMRAARTQLGQSPFSLRQVAQIGFLQPPHGATDGTALWKKQSTIEMATSRLVNSHPRYCGAAAKVSR
jgi:hypothetical protein